MYCPTHGKKLKQKEVPNSMERALSIYYYKGKCEEGHTVEIEDRQAYEQEGIVSIILS